MAFEEQAHRIAQLRQKSARGELTEAEMAEAIIFLRQGRMSAAVSSEKARAKRTPVALNADDLLDEL